MKENIQTQSADSLIQFTVGTLSRLGKKQAACVVSG